MQGLRFRRTQLFIVVAALSSATVLASFMSSSVFTSAADGALSVGWIANRPVDLNVQDDFGPSLAVDSVGGLYVAFERLNATAGRTSIVVSSSTDGGLSWSIIRTISDAVYSVAKPSLAVDVFGGRNDLFVAFEVAKAANDRDVQVGRCIAGSWSFLTISPTGSVRDDRSPKVAADGSTGVVHIVWEYAANPDDVDLVYSRSADRGAKWSSPVTLRGLVSDFNVYSQASITASQNNVYVAYRRAADSSSTTSDIDLSYGLSGSAPAVFVLNVDGPEPSPAQPSVATSDGAFVMVVFETALTPSDRDIHYSYASAPALTWTKDRPLHPTSLDERAPSLAAYSGFFHVAYYGQGFTRYSWASASSPDLWSVVETASDSNDIPDENARVSLAVVARGGRGYPAVAWTDRRVVSNKNIFLGTMGHTYTIDTSPTGLQVTVDGAVRQGPISLLWVAGSTHTVEALANVSLGSETKLFWQSWSDSGARVHSVVSGEPPTLLVASYSMQHKLTVLVNPPALIIPSQGGWYEDGAEVSISAPSPVAIAEGRRYAFSHWSGNVSGTEHSKPIVVDRPLTVQANYIRQFFVEVTSARGNATNSTWVDQGASLTVSVTSPTAEVANQTRFRTTGHRVDGGAMLAGASYVLTNVQASHSIAFSWVQQFYLDLGASDSRIPVSGGGWYDSGVAANISVAGIHQISASERYQFQQWSSRGPIQAPIQADTSTQTTVTMSSYYTVQARMEHQYLLSVSTNPPNLVPQPSGGGWRTASETAVLTATVVTGHSFDFWILDAEAQPEGQTAISVNMSSAHSATAVYTVLPTPTPTRTATPRPTTTTTRPPSTPTPSPSPASPSPTGTPTTSTTSPGGFLPSLDITTVGIIVGAAAAAVAVILLFLRMRRLGPFKK